MGGGRFYNLGPRRHRDRLRGQHLEDAPADPATGRPPAAGAVASRGYPFRIASCLACG
jgi:hypothetical protein